jgi:serine/threonine-protein kinase
MTQSISPGTRLGRFEILTKIGEGGMGQVYRARDQKLNRDVAIKVLPGDLTNNDDRLQRFEQEAQAAGALNHPNILAVYDVGTHDGAPYVVSELLEGETLRDALNQRSFLPRKATDYAIQLAHGLTAAHDKGIVHRDLKPDNVFITKDDQVKILDFGLAKLVQPLSSDVQQTDIATRKVQTDPGTVMGTVGYMSPEQVRGRSTDHRSDIFSFGAILYEMLSGQRAFRRDTSAETMTAILKEEPPEFSLTNSTISASLERIVRRCLEKQPSRRFQTASDLAFALEALSTPSGTNTLGPAVSQPAGSTTGESRFAGLRRERLAWIAAAVLALACLGLLLFTLMRSRRSGIESEAIVRYEISPPANTVLNLIRWTALDLTSDGSAVVFVGTTDGVHHLYLRRGDDTSVKLIPGTEGASNPVFSPDGKSIAFVANRTLKKTGLDGPVTSLRPVDDSRGLAWASQDSLIYSPDAAEGLFQISAEGGEPKRVSQLDASKLERTHRWPQVLPGGKAAIYTVGTVDSPDSYEKANIAAVNLATGESRVILQGASMARYSPTGHLVFARGGSLYAIGFDPETLSVQGKLQMVLQGVGGDETTGVVHFTIADNGTLAYVPGTTGANMRQISWVDRSGKVEPLNLQPAQYNDLRLSPDGTRAVVLTGSSGSGDVWVYDLVRATSTRLTFNGTNGPPIWSRDAKNIYYTQIEPGVATKSVVMRKPADGSREAEAVMSLPATAYIKSLTLDGKSAIFDFQRNSSNSRIVQATLTQGAEPSDLINTPFSEYAAALSPDDRWLAYQSNESGRPEVYVRDLTGTGARWQISTEGGEEPHWSPDGRELFYRNGNLFMSVTISAGSSFQVGKPVNLFGGIYDLRTNSGLTFDVDPKGNRFLMIRPAQENATTTIMVVLHWTDELRRLVPAGK